jgi:hypothetical protein
MRRKEKMGVRWKVKSFGENVLEKISKRIAKLFRQLRYSRNSRNASKGPRQQQQRQKKLHGRHDLQEQ